MKTLKFRPHLVSQILDGSKTVTWRLFDDKDLQAGDSVEFLNYETREKFALVEITAVREKLLGEINDEDFRGHEIIDNPLEHYREIYGDKVTPDTVVKIINFNLLSI